MVLPAEGTSQDAKLPADLAAALTDGAKHVTPNVARSTASLQDTAVIVGCDPAQQSCMESVAAALNVDQMLLVTVKSDTGGDVTVEVTAVSREAEPVTKQFVIHPTTRKQDLAMIEAAVPAMLDAEGHPEETDVGLEAGGNGEPGAGAGNGKGNGNGDQQGTGDREPGTGTGSGDDRVSSTRAPEVITIAGGALAVVGLGAWMIAAKKQGDIDGAPTATAADLDRLEQMEGSARSYARIGNGLVIAGALTAAAGAVWWWKVDRRRDTVVTPVVTPEGGGVVLEGRW
jgi:hypothetical protein